MRTAATVLLCIFTVVLLRAGAPSAKASSPAFEKLKALAGTWKGTDSEGKPFTASYAVVSAGTAVMETLNMGEDHGTMITMYHQNGKKMMMTHYCSMGNQPRMSATGLTKDGTSINFKCFDVTNLSDQKENYMMGLNFTFKDADHFAQKWTMKMSGTELHPDTFEYERVK